MKTRDLLCVIVATLLLAGACKKRESASGTTGSDPNQMAASLHQAAATSDVKTIRSLVGSGVDIDVRNSEGRTALQTAVLYSRKGSTQVLIDSGADVNARARDGRTTSDYALGYPDLFEIVRAAGGRFGTLHGAVRGGRREEVQEHLVSGANINGRDSHGQTPLRYAAQRGDANIVELLIASGADVNATDEEGATVLHDAAYSCDRRTVELLVSKGLDVKAADAGGWTVLHCATAGGSSEVVDFLLSKGASVDAGDAFGQTPLCWASSKGHKDVVELLLAKGAKVNARDIHGRTPLLVAFSNEHRDVVKLLIDHGANINVRDHGVTLLHRAFKNKDDELMNLLIAHNADFNVQDGSGETLLHLAAFTGDHDLATLSVAHGADVSTKDRNGDTALHLAAKAGHRELAEMLIANGGEVTARNGAGDTPLHFAAHGHKDVVELLMVNGAQIDAQDKSGNTPLHEAALRGYKDVVEFLIACGANPEIANNDGQTAMDKAARHRHADIVQLLKSSSGKMPAQRVPTVTERPSNATSIKEPNSVVTARDSAFQKRPQMQPIALSPQAEARRDARAFVQGNSAFACGLCGQLSSSRDNLFFSPYSISVALAMAYAGARGETESQMATTLQFSLDQAHVHAAFRDLQNRLDEVQANGEVTLHAANSLWPHQKYRFLDTYLALLKEQYGVSITPVDYENALEAARQTINRWVEEATQDKIENVIVPGMLDTSAKLVLVNAIYFKGTWEHQFDPAKTKDAPFHVTSKGTVQVPMMTQTEYVRYGETEDLQILELPYTGDDLSMLILLPRKIDGLGSLEASVSVENIELWRGSLDGRRVHIFLPKFQMTVAFELSDVLKSMGMVDAFTWPGANFAGMDGSTWLFINKVVHKAFVNVDEEGTEAAAATVVLMNFGGMGSPEPVFRADHPFLFLIQENRTGSILFMGRVVDPS